LNRQNRGGTAALDTAFGDSLVIKTSQVRTELIFTYEKVGHVDTFIIDGKQPDDTGNDKEKLVAHAAAPEKIIAFLETTGLKMGGYLRLFFFGERPKGHYIGDQRFHTIRNLRNSGRGSTVALPGPDYGQFMYVG